MKKTTIILVLLISNYHLFSQNDSISKDNKLKFGFNIGLNHSNLRFKNSKSENSHINIFNSFGFRLGLLADYSLNENFSISPKVELSFNKSTVGLSGFTGTTIHKIVPITSEISTHFIFKKPFQKITPYIYVGPGLKLPFYKNKENELFKSGIDLAVDFGIGFDKAFSSFILSPELKYSLGLLDLNKNNNYNSMNFHNISLIITFK